MNLQRVDRLSNYDSETLKLYCPVRDEVSLVKVFLDYHRHIGIKLFVFLDNGSIDGTLEYLLAQPDCIVYKTNDSYSKSNYAADWITELMSRHSLSQWAIYLDCDELLVYEGCEHITLSEFLESYRATQYDSFAGIMLDVYSAKPNGEIEISSYEDLLNEIFYVDSDYVMRRRPQKPWAKKRRLIEIIGGPRCRLHSSVDKDSNRSWFAYFIAGQVDRFIRFVPLSFMPLLSRLWPRPLFTQYKTPINYIKKGFRYTSSHDCINVNRAPYQLGILHLKFRKDLMQKIEPKFSYDNHFQQGLERFRLRGVLRRRKSLSLMYSNSVQYVGSQTLAEHLIIGKKPGEVWVETSDYFRTSSLSNRSCC
ncbi:MAG: glycosyltransferase family 2 protein [Verrucomicrobiota bacterium]|nr:glycosyltransferase family 2 protein [Verrucomicrobiota bacterium]